MSAAAFTYRHNVKVHIGATVIAGVSLVLAIWLIPFSWAKPYDEQYQSYVQWATIHSDLEVLHANVILTKGQWDDAPVDFVELLERAKHGIRTIEELPIESDAIHKLTIERQKHRWDVLEGLDRDSAIRYFVAILDDTAEMNRAYHGAIEHEWDCAIKPYSFHWRSSQFLVLSALS